MRKIVNIATILLGGFLFFTSCSNEASKPIEIGDNETSAEEMSEEITVTQSQFELANMKLGQLADYDFPITVRATGRIEVPAKNHIKASAYAGGYVKTMELIPGQKVKKGQVLFTLENPEFVQMQQDFLEAKEQLTYLKSDYERQETLASENIASQKNYLKAVSEYRVTLTQMEGLKKRLSMLNIQTDQLNAENLVSIISVYAPVSGFVTAVNAMKGMFLNPTDVAVEILDTDDLHLELAVFEKDILNIKQGQRIHFRIPDASLEVFEAEVHLIGKLVDEENRVVMVHAHLEDNASKDRFIPGMYVDAEIITTMNQTKGLPESAIVSAGGKDYVLISKGKSDNLNRFDQQEVMIGQRKDGFVQIINSAIFSGQEQILIEGAFNLIGIE
ncbi:MAG: efflux RND transporter periplasmic adaptor subunit [Saprospiraceae bacterium]